MTCDNCYMESHSLRRVRNDDICDSCFDAYLCCYLDDLADALQAIFHKPEAMEIAA